MAPAVSFKPTIAPRGLGGAAANSRERSAPERIDINSFVDRPSPENQGVALQAAEIAGKAPGFVAERPIALLDTVLGEGSPLGAIGDFGPIKTFGEIVGNISNLPSAIANQSTIDSLARGTREGWTDDQAIQSSIDSLANNDIVSGLAGALLGPGAQAIEGANENAKGRQVKTWGQFKADALARGFTAQDVQDYMDGKKASTDFGDKSLSSDALTNLGLKFGSDPWNLVFGAGSALKLASGTGLLARSVKAGAMSAQVARPSEAALAVGTGISKGSTWAGLAHYFGEVGRGIGAVPGGASTVEALAKGGSLVGRGLKAYQKTAIGLTAGQVAIKGSESTPLSGFLEPLYQINDAVWDNQPLSDNMAFSLFSAFHFDAFRMAGATAGKVRPAARVVLGTDVRTRVLRELSQGEGWGGKVSTKAVEARLGGREALDNLITHTHAQTVFKRLMANPAVKAEMSHYRSLDEAIAANRGLGEMVKDIVADEFKNGKVNGREVVTQLRAWYGERSGVDASLDFPWDGRNAVDRWVEYGAAAAPVSKIFAERGDIVMGLVETPMAMDLRHMRSSLGLKVDAAGNVPVAEIRRWLSRYPQLTTDKFWERFLTDEATAYPYKKLQGKLRAAEKKAPTARDVFHEAGDAESVAAKDELNATEDLRRPFVDGTGQVLVSRMRPAIAKRLKMDPTSVTDVMVSRGTPETAAFEEAIGTDLARAGFEVESVSQSVGASGGVLEPSVQVAMPTATLPELRLAAALSGKAASQERVVLAVTHGRLTELLLDANGYEASFHLPTTDRAQVQLVAEALGREFPDYTINDTNGRVSILLKGGTEAETLARLSRVSAEVSGYFPKDMLGTAGIEASIHPAYVEILSSKKGAADASFTETLAEARKSGDPRAGAVLRPSGTNRRAAPRDAAAGSQPDAPVGRNPGHERVTEDHRPLAESVGLGDPAGATPDPGFLYHATTEDALQAIARDGLKPHTAEYRRGSLQWSDGGTGARNFYGETPVTGKDGPLLRVRREDTGHVRSDRVEGASYSMKSVSPQHIEVWGGDGQWHPLDTFYETLEPEIVQAAADVAPVYRATEAGPFDPTPDTLSAGLRAIEDAGPAPVGDEAGMLSELATMGDEFTPENAARGQELNLGIERARLAKGEAKRGQVTYMARLDAEASRQYPLHRSLSDLPAEQLADLEPFEAYLREHYPAYTLQRAPNAAIMLAGEGDIAARYLRDRTWLGNVLVEQTKLGRLTDALFAPVKNSEMGRASKQALMNELIPHGATPKQVETFLARLDEQAKIQTVAGLHLFRNGQSLTQEAINRIAAGLDGQAPSFSPETIAAIGPQNFARVMDRASNRFIRMLDKKGVGRPGKVGALSRVLASGYGAYQHTAVGDAGRMVGKTLYPIFRFMADPRWHAMNLVEADMLNGARYGIGATRFTGGDINAVSGPSMLHSGGLEALNKQLGGDGSGYVYARRHAGHASRAFDAARPDTTLDVLRAFESDTVYQDLREIVRLDDVAHGRPERTPGEVWDEDIVQAVDRLLYEVDTKGASKTVIDEANAVLGAEETTRLLPFLQKVWEANDKTYHGIVKTLGGNPDRSNLERVLNSYWLYWPISYQIKATRWLVDVMAHRMGGAETNLAPAAMYAHYVDEHRKMLASDPDYVGIFKQNQTAWFMAQMLFPITPGDLGVSLNRAVRYGGGALGVWGKYKSAEDPVTAAGAMMSLGPTYTAELLARLGRELFRGTTSNQAP